MFAIAAGATVTISGLTITDGFSSQGLGGGIVNAGDLILKNADVAGNVSEAYYALASVTTWFSALDRLEPENYLAVATAVSALPQQEGEPHRVNNPASRRSGRASRLLAR